MKRRWNLLHAEREPVEVLAKALEIDPLIARMLVQRSLTDPVEAERFLHPRLEDLHDPTLMLGINETVSRIFRARERGEKVLIYGDYDVDGITSTVILKRALEMLGLEVDFYLPRRLEEGYGLKTHVIRRASEQGFRLVLTADSGIRAFDVCELARQLGLDLIVTDHHLPDSELPKAFAIINPRQPGCTYPDANLAAVGVVFKLIQALFREAGREKVVHHFLKLVAIGTIADLVPLTGENRILAKFGLAGLSTPQNLGLKALLEGSGVGEPVVPFDVGFKVAPRINAVTRMGGGREVVDLFSASDEVAARAMVEEMNSKNLRRRETEDRILQEIEERVAAKPEAFERNFLVVQGRDWHRGVIGIVASRLVEKFYRPVLVLSRDDEGCQGSGRSIPGFHLLDALDSCRELLTQFGGHAQAVGCTIAGEALESRLERLEDRLNNYAGERLSADLLTPRLDIEAEIPIETVSFSLLGEIERLGPFGVGNPVPIFASRAAPVAAGPFLLKEKHLKLYLGANGNSHQAIWWRNGEVAGTLTDAHQLDVAYTMSREIYQGESRLLLTIEDLRVV